MQKKNKNKKSIKMYFTKYIVHTLIKLRNFITHNIELIKIFVVIFGSLVLQILKVLAVCHRTI
jgi:hypothetical protein